VKQTRQIIHTHSHKKNTYKIKSKSKVSLISNLIYDYLKKRFKKGFKNKCGGGITFIILITTGLGFVQI
jgi:hypothetical protein